MLLFLASVATAQAQIDWLTLVTRSGSDVIEVEGATEIDISRAKTLHEQGVRFVDVRRKSQWESGHKPMTAFGSAAGNAAATRMTAWGRFLPVTTVPLERPLSVRGGLTLTLR